MSVRWFAGLVGVILIVVGLVLGMATVSIQVSNVFDRSIMRTADCGSVFTSGHEILASEQCAVARSAKAPWVWGLLGMGVVVVGGALVIRDPRVSREARAISDPPVSS